MSLSYPYPGCIVEFLEDNQLRIAMVLEDNGGKLRLLLPGRRETKLAANRILPWIGPAMQAGIGKDDTVKLLEEKQKIRSQKAALVPLMELWEMSQGEIEHAPAQWFAELIESEPDIDAIAAYGRALLACKTHFRFQPPEFTVYDLETVEKRLAEQKAREEKEAITATGSEFLRQLWEVASKKRHLTDIKSDLFPSPDLADRIYRILLSRMNNPDSFDDDSLWRMLAKGLPDVPHLPFQLLVAWGKLPKHYNFWLDRADYAPDDSWWHHEKDLVEKLLVDARAENELPFSDLPFISIDGPTTLDIDDAFSIKRTDTGWELVIALAAPAYHWPFGSQLDKEAMHRATSIYLPERDHHMLPECLGTDAYSLRENEIRTAFCLRMQIDVEGQCTSLEPFLCQTRLAANLLYSDVESVLLSCEQEGNPASRFKEQISEANEFAQKREAARLENGAVIMLREEPEVRLESQDDDVKVILEAEKPARNTQRIISEMMILASGALADWAYDVGIPLLHRTQNVTVPREYSGKWQRPEDLARAMRALIPSSLEVQPKPHAALGLQRYAQVTSPLRRYPDLINEAQIIGYIKNGQPLWTEQELTDFLDIIVPNLDAAGHVQRYRPRYWKLLYFKQQGDKVWYNGVITEENDLYVTVVLPRENIQLRGRRNIFGERTGAGMAVRLRVGKVNPLLNDIQILEVLPED